MPINSINKVFLVGVNMSTSQEKEKADEVLQEESSTQAKQEDIQEETLESSEDNKQELEKQLNEALATIDDQKDSVLRAKAEVDNIRRRAAIDVEKARKFALEKFANELLPVIDNLERALDVEKTAENDVMYEGVQLTLKSLISSVNKAGIEQVDPKGDVFNPDLHQAISMVPTDEQPANTVIQVMQKGYQLNGRLLRPAMVTVAQAK
jgi:molecular chaperone GrpE